MPSLQQKLVLGLRLLKNIWLAVKNCNKELIKYQYHICRCLKFWEVLFLICSAPATTPNSMYDQDHNNHLLFFIISSCQIFDKAFLNPNRNPIRKNRRSQVFCQNLTWIWIDLFVPWFVHPSIDHLITEKIHQHWHTRCYKHKGVLNILSHET